MANAKKDIQGKGGKSAAPTKLSKEMKADIEKMMEKRFSAIEKQLEKLKGSGSKGSNSKGSSSNVNGRKASGKTKAKQDNSDEGKKTGRKGKKKSNQRNEDGE